MTHRFEVEAFPGRFPLQLLPMRLIYISSNDGDTNPGENRGTTMSTRTMELTRVVDRTFGNRKNPMVAALREQARALDAAEPSGSLPVARKRFAQNMLRACLLTGRKHADN